MQAGEAAGQSRSRNTAAVSRRMGRAAPADREESRVGGGVGCARAGGRGPHLGVVSLRDVPGAGAEMGAGSRGQWPGAAAADRAGQGEWRGRS